MNTVACTPVLSCESKNGGNAGTGLGNAGTGDAEVVVLRIEHYVYSTLDTFSYLLFFALGIFEGDYRRADGNTQGPSGKGDSLTSGEWRSMFDFGRRESVYRFL